MVRAGTERAGSFRRYIFDVGHWWWIVVVVLGVGIYMLWRDVNAIPDYVLFPLMILGALVVPYFAYRKQGLRASADARKHNRAVRDLEHEIENLTHVTDELRKQRDFLTPAEECQQLVEEGKKLCSSGGQTNTSLMDDYRRSVQHFANQRVNAGRREEVLRLLEGGATHKPATWCGNVATSLAEFARNAEPSVWVRELVEQDRRPEEVMRRVVQAICGLRTDASAAERDDRLSLNDLGELCDRMRTVFVGAFLDTKPVRDFDGNIKNWKATQDKPGGLAMQIRQQCDHWLKVMPELEDSLNPEFLWDDERATL